MTKGAAFFLAVGLAVAALLHGGIWEYGDGFLYNRFTGNVVYVKLPEGDSIEHTRRPTGARPEMHAGEVASRRAEP